jgi:hypothetical protein
MAVHVGRATKEANLADRLSECDQILVHVAGAARVRVADLGAYVQGLDIDKKTTWPGADDN